MSVPDSSPDPSSESSAELPIASFDIELHLPAADDQALPEAARAIRQEHRGSSRWKRLTCEKVSIFAERDRGPVCVIELDGSVEFDWTWEGAIAFRPKSLDDRGAGLLFDHEEAAFEDEILWKGEVLEVDEAHGCLFVYLDNHEQFPTAGSFYVRPFEFLSVLDSLYNSDEYGIVREHLPARLHATQGKVHPQVQQSAEFGLNSLRNWWQHGWCILWGPPGTGKTWTTGQQVASVLTDPSERILVVSTTNRATDAVAQAIGTAATEQMPKLLDEAKLLRIGKGASLKSFTALGLESMLQGTEAAGLHQVDELMDRLPQLEDRDEKALMRQQISDLRSQTGDQSQRNFLDPNVRVVVSTAFKATSYLANPTVRKCLEESAAPFTTIFIDEAGLISRVAVAALSLLASRRVVLVGDSKQLSPISKLSRILPARQQKWLASSGLSHLTEPKDASAAVALLSEQRRMHPEVCRVVSEFQYDGRLTTASETRERPTQLSPLLSQFSRSIWYVLDEETNDLAAVRAERGPAGDSWVRAITPRILDKLFKDSEIRTANGLFISPFKAQSQAIAALFSEWQLKNWESSTVHSQQGSEADIVIFDTVNAGNYTWPFDEWKRLVNVALSRAREALIVIASRSEMEEPYLKPLIPNLTAGILVESETGLRWQSVPSVNRKSNEAAKVAESHGAYQVEKPTSSMGWQIQQRKRMQPVLSKEQQRLIHTELDGKPRLVRGVAGSGKSYVLCHWLARTVSRLQPTETTKIWAVYANRSLHKLLRESVEAAWANLWKDSLFQVPPFPWSTVSLLHVRDVLSGILPNVDLSMKDFEFDYDSAAEEFLNRQDALDWLPRCSAMFIDEAQDMGPSTLKLLLAMVEQSTEADHNSRAAHIFYDNAQNLYGRKVPKWSEFGLDMRGRATIMRESFRSTTPIAELALNVLYQLTDKDKRDEQMELVDQELVVKTERDGQEHLQVRMNTVDGPKPRWQLFKNRSEELAMLGQHLVYLIQKESISPNDICVIYNGKAIAQQIMSMLTPTLAEIGVELSLQTNRAFERNQNTLIVTTANSYKGYESEVIMIPGVDQFVTADGRILAHSLYVAMTRARSLLAMYGLSSGTAASQRLVNTVSSCAWT